MAVELKSNFAHGTGNLVTELPGGQSPAAYPNLSPAILQLLMARQRPQAPMAAPQPAYREPERPAYRPTMGSQQSAPESDDPNQRKYLTRTVIDPYASPYDGMQNGFGLQKIGGPKYVTERYIPGSGWEFDKLDPRRQGSGGRGAIDFAGSEESDATHPTENLQAKMPAYRSGSPSGGFEPTFDDRTGMIRPQEQPRAMNRADVARAPTMPRRIGGRIGGGFGA